MKKAKLLTTLLLMSSLVLVGCKDSPAEPSNDEPETTDPADNPGEDNPGEENPGTEDPGEDNPSQPEDNPSQPEDGGEESDPEPTQPENPDTPVTPDEPGEGNPSQPEDNPSQPVNPDTPSQPEDSGEHGEEPSTPTNPDTPSQPEDNPDNPDTPVTPDPTPDPDLSEDDLPEPTDEDPGEQDTDEHSLGGGTTPETKPDTVEFSAATTIGKNLDLDGYSQDIDGFVFSFAKNDGSNTPKSEKTDGGNVFIYDKNSFTVSSANQIKKIEFSLNRTGTSMVVTAGAVSVANSILTWEGLSKEITFTATGQYRFNNVKIFYYPADAVLPVDLGDTTIAEVLDYAKDIEYTPSVDGWYLSNVSTTVHVEIIDAIDSVNTGGTLDGNARGKMLAVDESGAMMISSSTDTTPTLSLYQRIKKWLKSGTTTYDITGTIAFFNGVPELKVTDYKFNSSLSITKNWDNYVKDTFDTQQDYLNDVADVKTNAKGYGVNHVVRFNSLTYFNKYNSAGSYLFLDKDGKIVPVYSLLDLARPSLQEGTVYDIIGLESMYLGRPSLRILKVISSDETASAFDLNDAVEVTDLKPFYSLSMESGASYKTSELTVYKADVYVSRYANDKYTFNTSYFVNGKNYDDKYTTGNTMNDAVSKYSLGMFNESLDFNSTFYGWVLEEAKTDDDAKARKVTIYFTLARNDKVDGKTFWRVNVLEDLVPEWVD